MGLSGNIEILPRLLAGEIASRTGKPERGKGIPRIFERATGGTFSRFVMISNDVSADLLAGDYRYLKVPFNGTVFSFDIAA